MTKELLQEIVLPVGTFRRYADEPFKWIQESGEKTVPELLNDVFDSGHCREKKR